MNFIYTVFNLVFLLLNQCFVKGFIKSGLPLRSSAYGVKSMANDGNFIKVINDVEIAYIVEWSSRISNIMTGPAVIYLPGLFRQKTDDKGVIIKSFCKRQDITFMCADYVGIGRSKGKFEDGTISRWAEDTITLIKDVILPYHKRIILVGHGVGAWISFVIANQRPDIMGGIIGLSADPDFTEELLWKNLPEDIKDKIMTEGICEITWGKDKYPITRNLVEDGRKNLLLTGQSSSLEVKCPVRLIHGLDDAEVPFDLALRLLSKISTSDASLMLMKTSGHLLGRQADYKVLKTAIMEVVNIEYGQYDLRSPASG